MKYWLVKSPFKTRTWEKVLINGSFELYGIRNRQASAFIEQMSPDDVVLYYFQKQVWGTLIVQEVTPDSTDSEGNWWSMRSSPETTFPNPIRLEEIRNDGKFHDHPIIRQPRLSVVPLSEDEFHWFQRKPGSKG